MVVITVPLLAASRDRQLSVHAGSWLKLREAALALYEPSVPIPKAEILNSRNDESCVTVFKETFAIDDVIWTLVDGFTAENLSG